MKKRRKYYILILVVVLVVFAAKYLTSLHNAEVVRGSASFSEAPAWNKLIAKEINAQQIHLLIDGTEVPAEDDVYVNEQRAVMVAADVLTRLFSCAVNCYDTSVIIEKGNNKMTFIVGEDEAVVNEERVSIVTPAASIGGRIYVPVSAINDYFNYTFSWDYQENTAVFVNTKPDEKIFPYAYDYRIDGKTPAVKNQADLGTCWAFASLTALETSLLPRWNYSFSADHMTYHNGYNVDQTQGGEYTMAMAYLTAWKGPVLEEDDPYGDGFSPDDLEPVLHVQEIQILESKNLDSIKKSVFLYGGVQSSLYMSVRDADGNSSEFYNADNGSYCYIGTEKPNHDIVIIGWDDAYSASNFSTAPEGDGAFICVNSWGEQFGDGGYFYVSYYDSNIGMHNLVYTVVEDTDNYDYIYQSDLCGWIGQLGYNRESAYFANVYEVNSDEVLEAVGFYATGADTEYEVYLVKDFENARSLQDKMLLASGSFANAGYYTVPIEESVPLTGGVKYGIVVHIRTPNSQRPIAIEYASDQTTSTVDLSDGEGYISLHGMQWEHVEETQQCNLCLKMYTNEAG